MQLHQFARDGVRVADDRDAAHAVRLMEAAFLEVIRKPLARHPAHRHDAIDRRPVGIVDRPVPVILLGLALRGPAGDDAHCIDIDLPSRCRASAFTPATCAANSSSFPFGVIENNASQLRIANA